ncbi:MAG: DUF1987 domain-containing protein [Flavobacteriales bacterium]
MEDLVIQRSAKSPFMSAKSMGTIELVGICVPEDSSLLFTPLKAWLEEYEKKPAAKTEFIVRLDYFNTSTANILLNLFRIVETIHKNGKPVEIKWFYEKGDGEIEESGKDYKAILSCPFFMIEIEH